MKSNFQRMNAPKIRGGRLFKLKGQIVSAAPGALLASVSALSLSIGAVYADTIKTVLTSEVTLDAASDHTITASGGVEISGTSKAAVEIYNDYAKTFTNSGTISVTGDASTGTGVYVNGDLLAGGSIINEGTIIVDLEDDTVAATGIYVDGDVAGLISNTGTIDVTSIATGTDAAAYGLDVDDDLTKTGAILNSGTITALAVATDDSTAAAYGIQVDGELNGVVKNTGTIDVLATAQGTNYAYAFGIQSDDDMSGSIVNSGTITVEANANDARASAYGIYVDGDLLDGGSITNSGTITANAKVTTDDSAYAGGFWIEGDVAGMLLNSGTITANGLSTDASSATAAGFYLEGDVSGSVVNSGTMTLTAQADASDASATGIYIDDELSGSVVNSGTITVTAISNSTSDEAIAYGVDVDDMQGTFANSGVISATASGKGETTAVGVKFDNFDGVITDLGTIKVSKADTSYAVYLGTGTGTMNVDTEDDVAGVMRVEAHNINLDAKGSSNVFRFEDADTDAGKFKKITSDPTSAWFVKGEGGAKPIYATVDSGDLTIDAGLVGDIGGLLGALGAQLDTGDGAQATRDTNSMSFLPQQRGSMLGGMRMFASVGAEVLRYDRTDDRSESDVTMGNITVGMTGTIGNGMNLAFGLGKMTADGESGPTEFNMDGIYAGVTVGTMMGSYSVDAGLGFGQLSTKKSRDVTNGGTADSDYDSSFFTAHVGVQRAFDVTGSIGLLGFGQLRHTQQNDDGYTEKGSITNAKVGDIKTSVTELKLGMEFSKTFDFGGIATGNITAVSRSVSGDSSADVTVFGQSASLESSDADYTGISIGFDYEQIVLGNAKLSLSAKQEMGEGGAGPQLAAGISWKF